MSIYYKTSKKKVPISEKVYYYPQLVMGRSISEKELIESITYSTTATASDTRAVISALCHEIQRAMRNGSVVNLPELGSFIPSIDGIASETPDKVNERSIKGIKVNFRKGTTLKYALKRESGLLEIHQKTDIDS